MLEVIHFLFPPLIACVSMMMIFGYLGIHILERKIIFIDIAMAQIAAAGATLGMVLFGFHEETWMTYGFAFGFAILASLFFAGAARRIDQIPGEAFIGVIYALAAASMLFLLGMETGSDTHLENILIGQILWVQWSDIILFSVVYVFAGGVYYIFRGRFRQLSRKNFVSESSLHWLWDFLFYVMMGLVITFTVPVAGVLLIFSLIVIPATFAAFFADPWTRRMAIAWAIGTVSILAGLAFSYGMDFSAGPSIVSVLVVILAITAVLKHRQQRCKSKRKAA